MPSYSPYPMVLNGVYLGLVDVRSDQKDYFDIPDATAAELAFVSYRGSISAHKRKIYSNRLDSTAQTREIDVTKKTGISRQRRKFTKGRGGKPIKIPTEMTSTPSSTPTTDPGATVIKRPSIRMTVMKFPSGVSLAEISAWLHVKLVNHKPKYIQSPAGQAYPIAPLAAGTVATGEDTTP